MKRPFDVLLGPKGHLDREYGIAIVRPSLTLNSIQSGTLQRFIDAARNLDQFEPLQFGRISLNDGSSAVFRFASSQIGNNQPNARYIEIWIEAEAHTFANPKADEVDDSPILRMQIALGPLVIDRRGVEDEVIFQTIERLEYLVNRRLYFTTAIGLSRDFAQSGSFGTFQIVVLDSYQNPSELAKKPSWYFDAQAQLARSSFEAMQSDRRFLDIYPLDQILDALSEDERLASAGISRARLLNREIVQGGGSGNLGDRLAELARFQGAAKFASAILMAKNGRPRELDWPPELRMQVDNVAAIASKAENNTNPKVQPSAKELLDWANEVGRQWPAECWEQAIEQANSSECPFLVDISDGPLSLDATKVWRSIRLVWGLPNSFNDEVDERALFSWVRALDFHPISFSTLHLSERIASWLCVWLDAKAPNPQAAEDVFVKLLKAKEMAAVMIHLTDGLLKGHWHWRHQGNMSVTVFNSFVGVFRSATLKVPKMSNEESKTYRDCLTVLILNVQHPKQSAFAA